MIILNESDDILFDEAEIIFKLKKLRTEANEALYKFERLGDLRESRNILYYLAKDSKETLNYIQKQLKLIRNWGGPRYD